MLLATGSALRNEHEVLFLLLDLAVIVVAARLLGIAAQHLGQPAVIGEIVAGIALGPTLLGRINADWPSTLFPEYVPLHTLADIGLIFFMFMVGLELDTRLIRSEGRRAVAISLTGILVPLALGVVVGTALFATNGQGTFAAGVEMAPQRLPFALFLGAAMCITAFPVLARILVDSGLYRSAVGAVTLCAAAIDDAVAWILLAGIVGLVQHGTAATALAAFGWTLLFGAGMVVVVRPVMSKALRYLDGHGRSLDGMAVLIAGIFLAALTTEKIGIHPVFGAFLFGCVVPRNIAIVDEFTRKIRDFTMVLLLPAFFVITGLRTDVFLLNTPSLLGWTALILAVAILGKFVGCAVAARAAGASARDARVIGALMNTRGLTELVILSIGYELGVLSDRTYAMMVIMAIVTTLMTAPLLKLLRSGITFTAGQPLARAVRATEPAEIAGGVFER